MSFSPELMMSPRSPLEKVEGELEKTRIVKVSSLPKYLKEHANTKALKDLCEDWNRSMKIKYEESGVDPQFWTKDFYVKNLINTFSSVEAARVAAGADGVVLTIKRTVIDPDTKLPKIIGKTKNGKNKKLKAIAYDAMNAKYAKEWNKVQFKKIPIDNANKLEKFHQLVIDKNGHVRMVRYVPDGKPGYILLAERSLSAKEKRTVFFNKDKKWSMIITERIGSGKQKAHGSGYKYKVWVDNYGRNWVFSPNTVYSTKAKKNVIKMGAYYLEKEIGEKAVQNARAAWQAKMDKLATNTANTKRGKKTFEQTRADVKIATETLNRMFVGWAKIDLKMTTPIQAYSVFKTLDNWNIAKDLAGVAFVNPLSLMTLKEPAPATHQFWTRVYHDAKLGQNFAIVRLKNKGKTMKVDGKDVPEKFVDEVEVSGIDINGKPVELANITKIKKPFARFVVEGGIVSEIKGFDATGKIIKGKFEKSFPFKL